MSKTDVPTLRHYQVPLDSALESTLFYMFKLERKAFQTPEFVQWVRNTFHNDCGICLLKSVWLFVQNNFSYIEDKYDEYIISPVWLLQERQGDCDDFALFIHCVLKIMNIDCKYILLGSRPGEYTHIAVFSLGVVVDGVNNNFNVIPKRYEAYQFI